MGRLCLSALVLLLIPPPARRTDPFTGMGFVLLPAGSFTMGSPATEEHREAQEQPHRVAIDKPFYLGVYEVTQMEWTKVMGTDPSRFAGCGRCPVERVNYFDVQRFIARLNASSDWPGFRLPTEAEWEYACRAGGTSAYGDVATLGPARANINGARTRAVGSYRANLWGLFDMEGNVWEWTADDYAPYPGATAPATPGFTPDRKVIRGGSWLFAADAARCALRYTHRPQDSGPSLGFRLAH